MNRLELVDSLRLQARITKTEASKVVQVVFDEMAKALARGGRVEIRGLCSFYVKQYGPYKGRNPKTGEPVKVKRKKLPFFKCGKELRERINHRPKGDKRKRSTL
ncbi:HU family DNA-binding protein [Thermodesulfobacteriota bacterium]